MGTDNKHVACYLPPDIEEQVTDYAQKQGITKKDGSPKLGTAVLEILREYFTESGTEYNTDDEEDSSESGTWSNTEYNTSNSNEYVTYDALVTYLEGVSCNITFPSTMGTKPRDTDYGKDTYPRVKSVSSISSGTNTTESSEQGDTVYSSQDSYSASQLASEIGISARTVRDHLSKLSIGEVYKEQWKLVKRKPYKLIRIE